MPSLPPPIKGELFYDGVWNEASVRTTADVEITRGLTSESSTAAEPMETICDLESGRDMLYAPRNPESPLYGKIGRNTPFRVSLEAGGPYLKTPTSSAWEFSTPDNSAFDITGDIDIRIDVKPDNWSSPQALAISWDASNIRWFFVIGQDRELWFWWSPTGLSAAQVEAHQEFAYNFANGERAVLRVTLDVDNGDGGWTCKFWHSKSLDADEWTMIGDPVTGVGVTSLFNATAPILIGESGPSGLLPDGTSGFDNIEGEVYGFQMWDGINDQLVVDLDIARDGGDDAVGGSSVTDATGFTWTRSGVATLSNQYYRSVGEIPSWPPTRDLTGNAVFTSIAPTGITRRMDAGNKPVDSALLRYIKAQMPIECWPLTDGKDKVEASPLFGQGSTVTAQIIGDGTKLGKFGSYVLEDWIEPVYATPSGAEDNLVTGLFPTSNTSGDWSIDFIFNLSGPLAPFNRMNLFDTGNGSNASPRIGLSFSFLGSTTDPGISVIWTYDDSAGSSSANILAPTSAGDIFDGLAHHMRITGVDGGGSTALDIYLDGEFFASTTDVPFSLKPLLKWEYIMLYTTLGSNDEQDPMSCGYVTYWDGNAPSAADFYEAFRAYVDEATSERILRLSSENNYVASISGQRADEVTLSVQEMDRFLQLLQDASDADGGYLLERRDELEIYYRGKSTLWNQSPVFTLDFTDGVIGSPFKPVDDDKLTENDVTVKRKRGGSPTRYVLEEGELSVQDFPNGVGRYDKAYEYIMAEDSDADNRAFLKLHLGTYNGVRYTRITLNLANKRVYAMLHKILRSDVGDKIRLLNIPKDHGPGPVDVLIQGYSEVIGPEEWSITFNCVPGDPWSAGQVPLEEGESSSQVWLDTAGSVSSGTADTTQNQIDLYTTATWRWTSDLSDSPYDIEVGGEKMTVLGPQGPLLDNPLFDENVDGWGGQNGTEVWTDEVVHPHPRARGSLKFTPVGGFSAGGPLSDLSAVGTITPGVVYALGAWVYSPNGFSDFRVVADWYDSAGVYLSTSGAPVFVASARTWTFVSATATAPASASRYRMRVRYGALADADDLYYVWAARLTLSTAAEVYDTFSRTTVDSWGSADSGQTWSFSGGAAGDYDTNGTEGTHSLNALNSSRYSYIPVSYTDQDVTVHCHTDALATGDSQLMGPVVRFTDFDNNYTARLEFQTDQDVLLIINKRVAAVQTNIATFTLPWDHTAGGVFAVRIRVDGDRIRAKAWPIATATEPLMWYIDIEDTDLPTGSNVGVRSTLGSANTNTLPFTFTYDNFQTVNNQSFSVTRSENGIVKSHVTGEPAGLADPSYVQS